MAQEKTPLDVLEAELSGASPYPGLRPFLPEDSRFFRGRDQQIREIGERLDSQGCVSVLGGSGSGKSSIVRAGVIPALRRKLIPGRGDLWRTAVFTPGLAPIDNLTAELAGILRPSQPNGGGKRLKIRELLYGPDGLGGFLPAFGHELDVDPGLSAQALERANLLVVIDQFEELFRAENQGKPQIDRLVNLVMDYWRRRLEFPGLYLALTMRTDDLHRCAEFIDLPEFINATAYLTRRLTEAELREAIVSPARPPMFRAGLLQGAAEPGAVDLRPYDVRVVIELLDAVAEIAHDPDHLPLLQHLLAVLWRFALDRWKREGVGVDADARAEVTRDDLAAALGFPGWEALEAHCDDLGRSLPRGYILRRCLEYIADQLYEGKLFGSPLTAAQRDIAHTAFCLLGEIDDRGSFKRRFTTEGKIARVSGLSAPTPDIAAFVHRFTEDHRLIWKRDTGEMDVSHEALMRNWPQLSNWLREDRDAADAYRQLDKRYRQCHESWWGRRGWLWFAWFARENGLLRFESLKNIAPLLARNMLFGFWAKPLHHGYWTQRVLSPGEGDARGYARRLAGKSEEERIEEEVRIKTEYADRFGFLRKSILRNKVFSVLPWIVVLSGLVGSVIFGQWWQRIAHQQTEFAASVLWGGLDGWSPVIGKEYVDNLWKITTANPDIRTEMVRQLPKPGNVRQMGFRGQPIMRAVGLRWPDEAADELSRGWKVRLEEEDNNLDKNAWVESSLACTTAVLVDRLNDECQFRAKKHFHNYLSSSAVAGGTVNPQALWGNGRILACLSGAQLLEANELDKPLRTLLRDAENAMDAGLKDPMAAGSLASTVTQAAWLLRPDAKADGDGACGATPDAIAGFSALRSVAKKSIAAGIDGLQAGEGFAPLSARPLVSLIAAAPCEFQREALSSLLDWAEKQWVRPGNGSEPSEPPMDTILILAQGFELAAKQHRNAGVQGELTDLFAKAARLIGPMDAANKGQSFGGMVILRWMAPLAEAGSKAAEFEALARAAGVAACPPVHEAPAPMVGGPPDPESDLRAGLMGRLLPLCVEGKFSASSEDGKQWFDDVIGRVQSLNKRRADGPGLARGAGGALNFALEGFARAVEALAATAAPTSGQRQQALAAARVALAGTGSAEEAAAWARAITALLSDKEDGDFVKELVEVLKYPNSGLTSREPSAIEPQNPTDIFIEALMQRKSIAPQGKPAPDPRRPGYFRKVLEDILLDPRFAHISLLTPPNDPKPKRDSNSGR
jgi:hypothetical protein